MTELKLERLDLPKDGWVEFNDPENLRGRDVDRLRASWEGARVVGDALNATMQIAAELLIAAWNVPSLPNAPVPSQTPGMWGELGWRDKLTIEGHMMPVVAELARWSVGGGAAAGSPQLPDSE